MVHHSIVDVLQIKERLVKHHHNLGEKVLWTLIPLDAPGIDADTYIGTAEQWVMMLNQRKEYGHV